MCVVCIFVGMAGETIAREKIVIGQSIALSGGRAKAAHFLAVPLQKLWLQEVNKKGGIYVPEEGRRLPVELIQYDDKSDLATTIKLTEKLITVDKVDILFGPQGTSWHLGISPLVTKYKFPIVGFTNATEKLYDLQDKYPYMFVTINSPRQAMEALKDMCVDLGVKRAAIIYVATEFGIEYASVTKPRFEKAGIDVVMYKNYPMPPTDLSPLIKKAKAANADAFIAHSYIPGTFMIPGQAKVAGYNPKLFYVALGAAWPGFKGKYKGDLEGIMGPGGWNHTMRIPDAKDFYDKFKAMHGRPVCNWSSATGYATCQIWEHVIENVGLKDREKQRDFIANKPHNTVFGVVDFQGTQFNQTPPSLIGQWQSGIFQSVAPKATRTAAPIYPKTAWPK